MSMPLDLHFASADERLAAFANVFDVWKYADTLDEHVQRRSASVQHHRATWYVGCLGGRVVVALGCYPLHFQLRGQVLLGFSIGSVHTLAEFRGQGFAAQLMRFVEDDQRRHGAAIGLLYSDIGTEYYERLGYKACPSMEGWQTIDATAATLPLVAEGITYPGASLAELYQRDHGSALISIVRPAEYLEFLHRKSPGDRFCQLSDSKGQPIGYARFNVVGESWRIRDLAVADRDKNLPAAYLAMARFAAQHGAKRLGGWLPDDPATRSFFSVRPRTKEITMLNCLRAGADLDESVLAAAHQFCEIDHV